MHLLHDLPVLRLKVELLFRPNTEEIRVPYHRESQRALGFSSKRTVISLAILRPMCDERHRLRKQVSRAMVRGIDDYACFCAYRLNARSMANKIKRPPIRRRVPAKIWANRKPKPIPTRTKPTNALRFG